MQQMILRLEVLYSQSVVMRAGVTLISVFVTLRALRPARNQNNIRVARLYQTYVAEVCFCW